MSAASDQSKGVFVEYPWCSNASVKTKISGPLLKLLWAPVSNREVNMPDIQPHPAVCLGKKDEYACSGVPFGCLYVIPTK